MTMFVYCCTMIQELLIHYQDGELEWSGRSTSVTVSIAKVVDLKELCLEENI